MKDRITIEITKDELEIILLVRKVHIAGELEQLLKPVADIVRLMKKLEDAFQEEPPNDDSIDKNSN